MRPSTPSTLPETVGIDPNEDREICARCGGDCCRTLPGYDSPDRMRASPDPLRYLVELLSSGEWVLSPHPWRIDGDEWVTVHYPRPATREEADAGSVVALGTGTCIFLTDEGCRLPFAERPTLCRALEPHPSMECSSPWGKRDAAIAWLPHRDLTGEALRLTRERKRLS